MNLYPDGDAILMEKGMAFTGIEAAAGNSQRIARQYLDSLQIEMRVVDAREASTETSFFGAALATPIMVAALSALERIHADGMVATARGAAAVGAAMWVGIGRDEELARIVDTGVTTVKIVKPYQDEERIFQKLEQAKARGVCAVGMDVSYSFGMKNGFSPMPVAPKTLNDIKSYVAATRLPFILKGVLSEQDALKAVEAGVAGVVVSHQGGTVLEYATPPAKLLPAVSDAVKPNGLKVFADCAIQSGLDAFKCMALGADAVGVGKAVMSGLTVAGAAGVSRVLDAMTAELKRTMSLTGMGGVGDMDPGVLWQ